MLSWHRLFAMIGSSSSFGAHTITVEALYNVHQQMQAIYINLDIQLDRSKIEVGKSDFFVAVNLQNAFSRSHIDLAQHCALPVEATRVCEVSNVRVVAKRLLSAYGRQNVTACVG